MLLLIVSGIAGLALLAWGAYLMLQRAPANPPDGSFYADYPQASVAIRGATVRAAVADTMARRAQGLSGRAAMGADQGMLFVFPMPGTHTFWMKDMLFALDFVWIRDGKVIGVTADVPPPAPGAGLGDLATYAPPGAVDTVLEVNAGVAAKRGWQAGDTVEVMYN